MTEKPTLEETLRRIDAVLDEPEPTPLAVMPLVAVMRQRDDRIGRPLREGGWTPPAPERGRLARAIGWFRR